MGSSPHCSGASEEQEWGQHRPMGTVPSPSPAPCLEGVEVRASLQEEAGPSRGTECRGDWGMG